MRSCWLCLQTDEEPGGVGTWTKTCGCSLNAHEACLVAWIRGLGGKKAQCPQCQTPIDITVRENRFAFLREHIEAAVQIGLIGAVTGSAACLAGRLLHDIMYSAGAVYVVATCSDSQAQRLLLGGSFSHRVRRELLLPLLPLAIGRLRSHNAESDVFLLATTIGSVGSSRHLHEDIWLAAVPILRIVHRRIRRSLCYWSPSVRALMGSRWEAVSLPSNTHHRLDDGRDHPDQAHPIVLDVGEDQWRAEGQEVADNEEDGEVDLAAMEQFDALIENALERQQEARNRGDPVDFEQEQMLRRVREIAAQILPQREFVRHLPKGLSFVSKYVYPLVLPLLSAAFARLLSRRLPMISSMPTVARTIAVACVFVVGKDAVNLATEWAYQHPYIRIGARRDE